MSLHCCTMSLRQLSVAGVALIGALLLAGCTFSTNAPPAMPSASPMTVPIPTPTPDSIVDTGPAEGAMGKTETDAEGTIRYTTVAGDVGGLICDRFGRAYWQLDREENNAGFDCHTILGVGVVVIPTTDEKPR